jgi:hypothetical protein
MCSDPAHQAIKTSYLFTGNAMFLLKTWLKCSRIAHPMNLLANNNIADLLERDGDGEEEFGLEQVQEMVLELEEGDEEGMEGVNKGEEADGPIDGSPTIKDHLSTAKGASKCVRAQFGRTRMHNEEIIVAPCGLSLLEEPCTMRRQFLQLR